MEKTDNQMLQFLRSICEKLEQNTLTTEQRTNLTYYYVLNHLPSDANLWEDINAERNLALGWYIHNVILPKED